MSCTQEGQGQREAAGEAAPDPDIAGIGVIAAFLATGLITVIAVVLAYATHSLPTEVYSETDWKITRRKPAVNGPQAMKYERRATAMRNLLLSLSDQQLVLGLAMLTAVFAQWHTITSWSALIVSDLVYISAYVHIGTILSLQTYFGEYTTLKWLRAFLMFSTLALWMSLTIIILPWSVDAVDDWQIFFECSVHPYYWIPGYQQWSEAVPKILFTIQLLNDYISTLAVLLTTHEGYTGLGEILTEWMLRKYGTDLAKERREIVQRKIQKIVATGPLPQWKKDLWSFHLVESYAFHNACLSYIWRELSDLLSTITYGSTTLIIDRQLYGENYDESQQNKLAVWGFGQIIPIVLLLLPLFSGLQGILEYRNEMRQQEQAPASVTLTEGQAVQTASTPLHDDHLLRTESPKPQTPGIVQSTSINDDADEPAHKHRLSKLKVLEADQQQRSPSLDNIPPSWHYWFSDGTLMAHHSVSRAVHIWVSFRVIGSIAFGLVSAYDIGLAGYFSTLAFWLLIWFRRIWQNVYLVYHARRRTKSKRA